MIAAGILPAAIEMMDAVTIEAAEAAVNANYPDGCGAVLIVELDGPVAQVERGSRAVQAICREHGAREIRVASDTAERAREDLARPQGRVRRDGPDRPDYYVQDGVVPRTKLPEVLRQIDELSQRARPARRQRLPRRRRQPAPARALRRRASKERPSARRSSRRRSSSCCIDAGGSITGEHGVGTDKACAMPLMFSEDDLAAMQRLRRAFDPGGLANPGKIFPTPRLCGEVPGPYRAIRSRRPGLQTGSEA